MVPNAFRVLLTNSYLSPNMDSIIVPLSPELLSVHVSELRSIDASTIGEPWLESNFFLPLPGKWEYSRLAFCEKKVVGFLIASTKRYSIHVHRIVVDASQRGNGLGKSLLQSIASLAVQNGVQRITLKVNLLNKGAIEFYDHLGFQRNQTDDVNLSLWIDSTDLLNPHFPKTRS